MLTSTATVTRYTISVETPKAAGSNDVDAMVRPYCAPATVR